MLKQQIEDQARQALKNGEHHLLETLRFLLASIKNQEIDLKREATDEDVISVVQKQVKQRKESIEAYEKGGRPELAEKEKKELDILNKFLPAQLSEEELKATVIEAISSLSEMDKKNFGKVMGAVMGKVKGKTDGNTVSRMVKESISS